MEPAEACREDYANPTCTWGYSKSSSIAKVGDAPGGSEPCPGRDDGRLASKSLGVELPLRERIYAALSAAVIRSVDGARDVSGPSSTTSVIDIIEVSRFVACTLSMTKGRSLPVTAGTIFACAFNPRMLPACFRARVL